MCRIFPLPHHHPVLAFGPLSNFFELAGVEEHALMMKSLADATALHAHVIDKLEHAELVFGLKFSCATRWDARETRHVRMERLPP
jgi:hypothetical protein